MDNVSDYIKGLKIVRYIWELLFRSDNERGVFVDKIVAEEKCLFVVSSINIILSDFFADRRGKNIVLIGILIQKMLLLLRNDLPFSVMESLDDFLKAGDVDKLLGNLANGQNIGHDNILFVIRRLSFYQHNTKEEVGLLRKKL